MKRIVQFLSPALILLSPASTFGMSITGGLYASLTNAVAATKTHSEMNFLKTADFVISKFDKSMVETFGKAWRRVGNGNLSEESVVLILKMANGGYQGRDLGSTNEHKQFTFRWHPATIAIVHTHPNSSSAKPQLEDIAVADKYHVPIFTITNRGMYVYDPTNKKTRRVMDDLNWLDFSKWKTGRFLSE